jgi:nucleotide-binding universal stress UspA family protein
MKGKGVITMFHDLLVPLDGSTRAELALPVAARLARATGATLTLLRVVPPLDDLIWQSIGPLRDVSKVHEQEQAHADVYMQQIAACEMLVGLHVIPLVAQGDAAQRILAEAQAKPTDLIIMCSHGETGFKRWAIGSVSLKVARQSPIPLLLLRPAADKAATLTQTLPQQIRILVPLDGSQLAEEALAPALALTEALSAPEPGWLHLIGIIPLFTPELTTPHKVQAAVEAGQEYLASVEYRLQQQAEKADIHLTVSASVTLRQDVPYALAELAEVGDGLGQREGLPGCDVIAMATHGRSGLAHWALGSVTERVMDATRLPMLIVRPQQAAASKPAARKERDPEMVSWPGLL